jgi:hypothetical protein
MSILPGSEGRRDPERAEAARRERVRFARDIGDEHTQAWAHEPRRRPRKFTVGTFVVLVVFVVLGAIPLLTNDGEGGLVRADCTTVSVEVGPSRVQAGAKYTWQFTGPDAGRYVVALGTDSVTVDASGRATAPTGTVLGGPTGVTGCRSTQTVTNAPAEPGSYQVVVFRLSGDGWTRAAVALLTVT